MKKVLLVGGAGYVGSVLAEELLERGYAVKILDRLYFGEDGLRKIRDRVELVVGDMRMVGPEVLDGVCAIINVGGLSNDPTAEYNPQANHEMNTVATRMLADFCKTKGIRRYVFASSCSIYDRGVGDDQKDTLQDETSDVHPRAAYARSKYEAERGLLEMADADFCPVILRQGTIYGFSPRMRYDLVVNTFVKDALSKGVLTLDYGGEMWRPLVDVRDVAQAYIACLNAEEEKVHGEIFNVSFGNLRISELALRVRETVRQAGLQVSLQPDYRYKGVRSYRVSARKIERVLGVRPRVSIEESVRDMFQRVRDHGYTDFDNPKYYNIRWMRLLEEAQGVIQITGSVFDTPPIAARDPEKVVTWRSTATEASR
jgi:nucleoside-diphosphate-sugar epimerase